MIIKINHIQQILEKNGYKKTMAGIRGEHVYWKVEGEQQKVVAIEDAIERNIKKRASLIAIRKCILNQFDNLTAENVLIVLVGGEISSKILIQNTISLNKDALKGNFRRTKSPFLQEKNLIKMYCKELALEKRRIKIERKIEQGHLSFWVYVLIGLNIYLFFKSASSSAISNYGLSVETLRQNQTYRYMTYMFMHNGIRHLITNMISLFVVGRILEEKIGSLKFLFVYLFGGFAGGLASMWYAENVSGQTEIFTVGASGAIFAVLGALVMHTLLSDADRSYKFYIMRYCVVSFALSALNIRVDNICHLGGLLFGLIAIYIINSIYSIATQQHYILSYHYLKRKRGFYNG